MLHLYNSLTKEREPLKLRGGRKSITGGRRARKAKTGLVTIYTCGPTVYDYAHIGNLRAFLFSDILRRYLEYSGFKVKLVMNITDVGHITETGEARDKIEVAAEKEKKSPEQIAEFYTRAFFRDINTLGIKPASKYPRATKHIRPMIHLIQKLIKKGYAYRAEGGVYFDLSKFPEYGKLSGNTLLDLIAGARVPVIAEKRQPYDFALWINDPKHIMQWASPWGRGYPGWHIECSAMSIEYLGSTIDIHTGGEDNKFPHHECEIAQSEAATGKQFVRYWLHVKHLLVDGEKMSKSKGNFYTLNDLLEKGYSPRAIRYLLLKTHYRQTLNFTFLGLRATEAALVKLDELLQTLRDTRTVSKKEKYSATSLRALIQETREDFIRAMDEDLNVSKALSVIFHFLHKTNAFLSPGKIINVNDKREALKLLKEFGQVFGIELKPKKAAIRVSIKVQNLVKEREEARKKADWKSADNIRKEIERLGFIVEDTPKGPKLKKAE